MDFKINNANVTVVFKELNRDLLKRDLIKKAFNSKDCIITEFPDLLLVVSPNTGEQAIFSDNRLSINLTVNKIDEAAGFIGQACINLIKAAEGMEIITYGYNLYGHMDNGDFDFNKHLLHVCYGGGKTLSQYLGTEIVAVAPRFSFYWEEALFNLALAPQDDIIRGLDFHCNIHFIDAIPPAADKLREQLLKYTECLRDKMARLMEVQK